MTSIDETMKLEIPKTGNWKSNVVETETVANRCYICGTLEYEGKFVSQEYIEEKNIHHRDTILSKECASSHFKGYGHISEKIKFPYETCSE